MPELAYVDGTFGPIESARVSIEDRGYQFGDGVYEVIVAYGNRPFLLDAHMQRLRRSAAAIGLRYDFDRRPLEPVIEAGLQRSGFADALVYLQLTRGVAPRSHVIPERITPTVVMTFKPLPMLPADLRERGARVITVPDTRWAHCYIKAITLLPNVLAKNEAFRRGYDDAVFVTEASAVRECTSANLFIVNGSRLTFPPRTEAVLHGVTQGYLLDCATSVGLSAKEEPFDVSALQAADEVFMSGTTVEVLGITSVDDALIADGRVGPITARLYDEFWRRVRAG